MTTAQIFISATETDAGKTFLTRGLARAAVRRGLATVAVKPVETGCSPHPEDARALAAACQHPALAQEAGFYRARLPLAPAAVSLTLDEPAPDLRQLIHSIDRVSHDSQVVLVEGAGGLMVPLNERETFADLASALAYPVLIVAPDRLGVLSHALTAYESAMARKLDVRAVVLVRQPQHSADKSPLTNSKVLASHLPIDVVGFPRCEDDDDALADAVERAGLLDLFLS